MKWGDERGITMKRKSKLFATIFMLFLVTEMVGCETESVDIQTMEILEETEYLSKLLLHA